MTVTEAVLAPATTAVAARDVLRRYGEGDYAVDALRGVSLAVPSGQFAAIMGPSGSGKSTLMHILAGLDQPTAGAVEIGGQEITTMGDKELTLLRRRQIGFVFQAFNLVPTLTAEENIVLPLAIAGRKTESSWIEAVIGRVGLDDRRDRALEQPAHSRSSLSTRPETANSASSAASAQIALTRPSTSR